MNKIGRVLLSIFIESIIWLDNIFRRKSMNNRLIDNFYSKMKNSNNKKLKKLFSYFRHAYYRKYYCVSPIDDNLILLDCFWGRKIGCHPYAIYREIIKDSDHDWKIVWVRNNNVTIP